MVITIVILDVLVGLALLLNAAKYAFGPVPLDYHAQIFAAEGLHLTPNVLLVLRAFYAGLAGGFLGLALTIAVLAAGPLWNGAIWAQLVISGAGLCLAIPLSVLARRVEMATGVRTPWRVAAALGGLLVLALVLSIL